MSTTSLYRNSWSTDWDVFHDYLHSQVLLHICAGMLLPRLTHAILYVVFQAMGLTVQQWAIMVIKFLAYFVYAHNIQQFAAIQVESMGLWTH